MAQTVRITLAALLLSILMASSAHALGRLLSQGSQDDETILVGRVSHVEGSILRYMPEEGEWAPVVKDAPFGLEDKLRSAKDSRAEIILPNNTWLRMNGATHIQLISLQNDRTGMNMVHGIARFHNKGSQSLITITTPFGDVTAPTQSIFDLYLDDTSVEVMVMEGSVYFNRKGDQVETEVMGGAASLVADRYTVTAGEGYGDPDWNAWNAERDSLWAQRARSGKKSAKYLPSNLHDHGYILDDYGVWERVYHDGAYGYLWRPLYVSAGWAPFTVGSWTVWYGDHVWIPCEPFGYVTHHYGNWVHTGGCWYWAPPVTAASIRYRHPSASIGFAWYPGRVAWFNWGVNIGWVPLAPYEPYYCRRRWGPRACVVKKVKKVHIRKCRYRRHAVTVKGRHFYATDNYRHVRIKNRPHRKGINTYYAQPFGNHKSVGKGGSKARHAFKTADRGRKFHRKNVERGKHGSITGTSRGRLKSTDRNIKSPDSRRWNAGGMGRPAHLNTRNKEVRAPDDTRKHAKKSSRNRDINRERKSLQVGSQPAKVNRLSRRLPTVSHANKRKRVKNPKGSVAGKAPMEPVVKRQPSRAKSLSHKETRRKQRAIERRRPTTLRTSERHAFKRGVTGNPRQSRALQTFQRFKSQVRRGSVGYNRSTPRSRMHHSRSQSRGGFLSRRR